jgi:hypothetical protein
MFHARFIGGTSESAIVMDLQSITQGADEITIEEGSGTVYASNVKSLQ